MGMNGTTFGQQSFTNLDYADDVSLLDGSLFQSFRFSRKKLLHLVWKLTGKTMVQALGSMKDEPPSLHVGTISSAWSHLPIWES